MGKIHAIYIVWLVVGLVWYPEAGSSPSLDIAPRSSGDAKHPNNSTQSSETTFIVQNKTLLFYGISGHELTCPGQVMKRDGSWSTGRSELQSFQSDTLLLFHQISSPISGHSVRAVHQTFFSNLFRNLIMPSGRLSFHPTIHWHGIFPLRGGNRLASGLFALHVHTGDILLHRSRKSSHFLGL